MCEIEDCKPIGLGIRKTARLGCVYTENRSAGRGTCMRIRSAGCVMPHHFSAPWKVMIDLLEGM